MLTHSLWKWEVKGKISLLIIRAMCHGHSRNDGIWTHLKHCQVNEGQKTFELWSYLWFISFLVGLSGCPRNSRRWKLASEIVSFCISSLSSLRCSTHPLFARNRTKVAWRYIEILKLCISSHYPLKQKNPNNKTMQLRHQVLWFWIIT